MVKAVTVTRVVGLFLYLFDQRSLGGKNKMCELHKRVASFFLTKQTVSCSTSVTIFIFIYELA